MTHAGLWLKIFCGGFALLCAALLLTLSVPVPQGDLSRIGMFTDRDFGWRVPQPDVDPRWLKGASAAEADVLVIGDSFSATHRWQSVLAKDGLKVANVQWDSVHERLCDDFDAWLREAGFRGRLVIVESVERVLWLRLAGMEGCTRMVRPMVTLAEPRHSRTTLPPPFAPNVDGKIFSGWTTYWHAIKSRGDEPVARGSAGTVAAKVNDGCEHFSHRLCERALFLSADLLIDPLTPQNLERMRQFSARQSVPVMWLVIPNKTTVYLAPERNDAFTDALAALPPRERLGPDMFAFAKAHRDTMRDFYFPNDTHWSTRAELLAGETIRDAVRARLAGVPATGAP